MCLICHDVKEDTLGMLPCGHSFCLECSRLLTNRSVFGKNAKCPHCRAPFEAKQVVVIEPEEKIQALQQQSLPLDGMAAASTVLACRMWLPAPA
jgi:hypothetical protein